MVFKSSAKTSTDRLVNESRSFPGLIAGMMYLGQLMLKPCSLVKSSCIVLIAFLLIPTVPPASAAMAAKLTVRQCFCSAGMRSVLFTMYMRAKGMRRV